MPTFDEMVNEYATGIRNMDAGIEPLQPIDTQQARPVQQPARDQSFDQMIRDYSRDKARDQSLQQPIDQQGRPDPVEDKIGFWENIDRGGWGGFFDKATFGVKPLVEAASLYGSVTRFQDDLYDGSSFGDDEREADQTKITEYLEEQAEIQERGLTIAAKAGNIVGEMLPFMVEFIATGGLAALGKKAVTKGILKLATKVAGKSAVGAVGKLTARKATAKLTGWVTSAAIRTALTPHRSIQGFIENRMPDLQISPEGQIIFGEAGDSPFRAAYKAIGNQLIEMASEESGAFLGLLAGKVASKLLPKGAVKAMRKLKDAWIGAGSGRTAQGFADVLKKGGFNGVLEEMGEERLGALMRVVAGIDDGEGSTFEKIGRALYPGQEQMWVELIAFSVPGVTQAGVAQIFKDQPDKTTYSRRDMVRMFGIKANTSAEARQDLWDEHHPEVAEELPVLGEEGIEAPSAPIVEEAEEVAPAVVQEQETLLTDLGGELDVLEEEDVAVEEAKAPVQEVKVEKPVKKAPSKGKVVKPKAVKKDATIPIRLRTGAFNRIIDSLDKGIPIEELFIGASQNRLDEEQKQFLQNYAKQKVVAPKIKGKVVKPVEAGEPTTAKVTPQAKIAKTVKAHKAEILPRKDEILAELDAAIAKAPTESTEKLHFEIDGGMNIFNNKKALQFARDRVAKLPKTERRPLAKKKARAVPKFRTAEQIFKSIDEKIEKGRTTDQLQSDVDALLGAIPVEQHKKIDMELNTSTRQNRQGLVNAIKEARASEKKFGSKNIIVTREQFKKDNKAITDGNQLAFGLNPALLVKLVRVGTFYVEGGIREFNAWSAKMIEDLGERIRPHLQTIWDEVQKTEVAKKPVQKQKPVTKEVKRKPSKGKQKSKSTLAKEKGEELAAEGVVTDDTYDPTENKVEREKAEAFVANSPQEARRIALGDESDMGDLLPNAVRIAYFNKMMDEGKKDEATRIYNIMFAINVRKGQDIAVTSAFVNEYSTFSAVKKVTAARRVTVAKKLKKAGRKGSDSAIVEKEISRGVSRLSQLTEKKRMDMARTIKFIDSLEC